MTQHMNCEAGIHYENMRVYLEKLSDGQVLGKGDDKALRGLLAQYWAVKCPESAVCRPNTCVLARQEDWIAFHGYPSALELLKHLDYEDVKVMKIISKKSVDALSAHWARRRGSISQ